MRAIFIYSTTLKNLSSSLWSHRRWWRRVCIQALKRNVLCVCTFFVLDGLCCLLSQDKITCSTMWCTCTFESAISSYKSSTCVVNLSLYLCICISLSANTQISRLYWVPLLLCYYGCPLKFVFKCILLFAISAWSIKNVDFQAQKHWIY